MHKNIIITDFNELLQHNESINSFQTGIFVLNEVIAELVATPHIANFYGISYCFKETCKVKNNLETYIFGAGKLFLLRPGEVHQVEASEGFTAVHILVDQSFILRNFMLYQHKIASLPFFRTDFPNLIDLNKKEQKKIIWYINKIMSLNKDTGNFANHILESLLTAFIYEICNIISLHPEKEEKKLSGGKEIFEKFTALLAENHAVSKNVKFYADKLNISPAYLNEVIKRKTTKSALTVIHEYITFKVKIFLKHTDYNISEIAEIFNFPDATTFIRFFKKHTCLSPLKFRNSLFTKDSTITADL